MTKFAERYGLADPEKITLEDVDFYVRLPTSANKRFERELASSMAARDPESGQFTQRTNASMREILEAQHLAFLRTSVVRVEGLDFDPDQFYSDYPEAVDELYNLATERAMADEEAAAEGVGKSEPSSTGQDDGPGSRISTKAWKKAAG